MKHVLLFLAITAALPAGAEEGLERRGLLEGKVTILVPASFAPMSDEYRKAKYPGANAPSLVLTDASTTVNIAFEHRNVPVTPGQIRDSEASIRETFSRMTVNSAGIRLIDGHEFMVADVDIPLPDGINHNLLAMTAFEGRMLVITYNCMLSRDANCGALGNRVIESIRLKDKSGS